MRWGLGSGLRRGDLTKKCSRGYVALLRTAIQGFYFLILGMPQQRVVTTSLEHSNIFYNPIIDSIVPSRVY